MGTVFVAMSMSLDGVIGGSGVDTERMLHEWFFAPSERNAEVIEELRETIGAVVMGRRTYDEGNRNDGFIDNPYPVDHFVLTHDVPETSAKGETSFTFVTDGIQSALTGANEAAGADDVCVMGGADTVQQFLKAGLIDEIRIHLVPAILGDGIRLFETIGPEQIELELTKVIESPDVTHLWFRVLQ